MIPTFIVKQRKRLWSTEFVNSVVCIAQLGKVDEANLSKHILYLTVYFMRPKASNDKVHH